MSKSLTQIKLPAYQFLEQGLFRQQLDDGLFKLFAHMLCQIGVSSRLSIGLEPDGVN